MSEYTVRHVLIAAEAIFDLNCAFVAPGPRPEAQPHYAQVLQSFLTASSSEHGFVATVDDRNGATRVKLVTEANPASRLFLAAQIDIRHDLPLVLNDLADDPRTSAPILHEPGVTALCLLPVRIRERLVAVVGLANRTGGFDGRERILLGPLLQHTAMATHFLESAESPRQLQDAEKEVAILEQRNNWYKHRQVWSSIAHDLNGACAAISLQSQMLRNGELRSPECVRGLDRIADATIRLAQFGTQIENLGRLQDSEDLHGDLDEALVTLKFLVRDMVVLPASLDVVVRAGSNLRVNVPTRDLLTVLFAVAANAIEACGDRDRRILMEVAPAEGTTLVAVTDNGDGIDPQILPFVSRLRVTSKGAGRGSGLVAVRALLERVGGRLDISSSGSGTTVELGLPVR